MASVSLKNINKEYDGGVLAVKNVSIEIHEKEFVVLVGPSGCGKSTTLRMIAGLEEISNGTLTIDGVEMNSIAPKDRDIAMVFQNYALYPHMSVYENMAFGLKLRKFPQREIEKRVNDAADILGLKEYLHRKPKALSGGQRQRVAVGRAIVRKPKVFLFDEPLSNLDAKMRVQMRTEISKLHKQLEATMIYVTHDQTEAMTMGDRIVVMKDGVVQQIDTPLNLYNFPQNKFVAGFIGSPAMNFIEGRISGTASLKFTSLDSTIVGSIPKSLQKQLKRYFGKEVWLGLRPEHITIGKSKTHGIKCVVDVTEPMGSEIFIYITSGESKLVLRETSHRIPKTGDTIDITFDMNKAHFFDKITEEKI